MKPFFIALLLFLTAGVSIAQPADSPPSTTPPADSPPATPGEPKPSTPGNEAPDTTASAPINAPPLLDPTAPTRKNTSLVKVNVTSQPWSDRIPWQKSSPSARRGLGVLLKGNRILVTGQMVADATYIELELADSGRRIPAKVKGLDYEANLALLEPAGDAKTFFEKLTPLEIEPNASVGDLMETWQLGRVGELIVTPLQINKVLTSRYVLDTSLFLVYEALGIIRSEANSFTLPVTKDGKLTGLLLRYDSKDQTSTVLPGPIIQHFLKDMDDGEGYRGFPSLGVEFQQTLDDQFREYIGMKPDQQGVYVSNVTKDGSAEAIGIKKEDIILEMNGHKIDSRGDYQHPQYGTLNMSHIVRGASYVGDELKVKLLREGKEQLLSGKLIRKEAKDFLVPPFRFDTGTNYLIQGGLLFQELSLPYLKSFGENWETSAPLRLVFAAQHTEEYEKAGRRKIVILTATLPTRTTQGYESLGGLIVNRVNGKPVNDLADLNECFKEPKDGIHTVEFDDFPKIIYLDAFATESDNLRLIDGVYRIGSLKRIQ
ncbi:PDZ domain-containing protein [Phragmitibacter flavus]|uniref:PDZ domain-containing protein n=1 Tax=Phragmitibacter flavus TaxID=2576071 RepID=A0A5R8KJY2_9BACT|nr:PDZ domain-containing protein [Phragmitibacter flavus]TLD72624.1 PDZ domain-containing protein [Phragmitibacter flavus]